LIKPALNFLYLALLLPLLAKAEGAPRIAIVIDDLGYEWPRAEAITHLPYPITLAVIPNTPYAHKIAMLGQSKGQEVIMHVPMQPKLKSRWENGLHTQMAALELQSVLRGMLLQAPHIRGINNHGGSLLTEDGLRMAWVMEVLAEQELYMLDSRTTALSRVPEAAQLQGLAYAERDVFLDHSHEEEDISEAFQRLRKIAREHGEAVAIGHPHTTTLEVLKRELPLLHAEGFSLEFCSALTKSPNRNKNDLVLEINKQAF
jgi:polysaccharide deacetylase 2 family uncharacterized protein YibQ